MSSGMNMEEAKKVAEKMSYKQAILNCLNAKCVPNRKATKIKLKELIDEIDMAVQRSKDIFEVCMEYRGGDTAVEVWDLIFSAYEKGIETGKGLLEDVDATSKN